MVGSDSCANSAPKVTPGHFLNLLRLLCPASRPRFSPLQKRKNNAHSKVVVKLKTRPYDLGGGPSLLRQGCGCSYLLGGEIPGRVTDSSSEIGRKQHPGVHPEWWAEAWCAAFLTCSE